MFINSLVHINIIMSAHISRREALFGIGGLFLSGCFRNTKKGLIEGISNNKNPCFFVLSDFDGTETDEGKGEHYTNAFKIVVFQKLSVDFNIPEKKIVEVWNEKEKIRAAIDKYKK